MSERTNSGWQVRSRGPLPDLIGEDWPHGAWFGEYQQLGDEIWFSRLAPEGDPELPPVVLVHGLVVSGDYFLPVATYLDDHFRLFVPDLPGFGRSSAPRRAWTVPLLAAGLGRWMDAHGLRDAVLVGNSLGCQIITELADHRPELIRGMVLVAPTVDPAAKSALGLMIRGARDIPRESQSLWRIWVPDLLRSGPVRALLTLRHTLRDPQLTRLARISVPALIVGGERDPIVPPVWVHAMASVMPKARAVIIPGAPHAMNYSSPRELGRIIRFAVYGHTAAFGTDV